MDENWSALTTRTESPYGNLPHGSYTFKVRAMNSEGYWSEEFCFSFSIRPPWWKTNFAYTLYFLALIGSVMFIVWWNGRKLRARAKQLEIEVEQATQEIRLQKEVVEKQKKIVEEKHKEITDSINYAERIQRSFLASDELLQTNLKEYFVFFQPKDVVSGDFYWAASINDANNHKFMFCTADSTGHGVPGAIMSLLNITSLEKAIEVHSEPAEILNATRKTIIERLKKDGSTEGGKDGMDCSLIAFDFKNQQLTYAAANNPIWIIRQTDASEQELIELKPDKMPVGKHDKDTVSFKQQSVELRKGDLVYALTDGFADQFGGERGKKLTKAKFKEAILNMQRYNLDEQKKYLLDLHLNYKGNLGQVDDICVIGVRV
jgi:serine phosphatase RsbU (regulator of sigma subunit)